MLPALSRLTVCNQFWFLHSLLTSPLTSVLVFCMGSVLFIYPGLSFLMTLSGSLDNN
jgi:hypothetical protein